MDIDSVSTVNGALPIVIVVAGLVSIPVSIGWTRTRSRSRAPRPEQNASTRADQDWSGSAIERRPVWRRQLVLGIPIAAALVGLVAIVDDGFALVPYQFPNSYYLWVGLVLLAVVLCILGWIGAPWWRRVISLLSVGLTALMAFTLINKEYQYWPTVGSLFGKEAQNQVDSAQLKAAQLEYRKTRKLPDHGFTVTVHIPGTASGFAAREAYVWLPPVWVSAPTPKLPVIEMLFGYPGSPGDWTRAGLADQTAGKFAEDHGGHAPILVMPDSLGVQGNDTECVNSQYGNAETYLTTDVPAFIRKTYGTLTATGKWGIAGFSAGGMCATMLALRHPDVYSVFGNFGGLAGPTVGGFMHPEESTRSLFGGSTREYDAHQPESLLRSGTYPNKAAWFEAATGDPVPLAAARLLVPLARAAGIVTCAVEKPGSHDFDFFSTAFVDALPFLASRLGIGDPPPDTSALCQA